MWAKSRLGIVLTCHMAGQCSCARGIVSPHRLRACDSSAIGEAGRCRTIRHAAAVSYLEDKPTSLS